MKKIVLSGALLAVLGAAVAAETVVAEWDFTKEQLTSGKYTMSVRGEAKFVVDTKTGKKVLSPCTQGKGHGKGCGLSLKGNPQKDFLPMDGFEVQARIRYVDPANGRIKGSNMYIFDGAYASKNGAALLMHITGRGEFMLRVVYGDGSKLYNIPVMAAALGDGEWHDVALKYFDDQITLKLDGKEIKSIQPAKPLTDSTVRFSIGDRVAASYQPFPGLIEYIKVIKL